jgi:hypothetical protein
MFFKAPLENFREMARSSEHKPARCAGQDIEASRRTFLVLVQPRINNWSAQVCAMSGFLFRKIARCPK